MHDFVEIADTGYRVSCYAEFYKDDLNSAHFIKDMHINNEPDECLEFKLAVLAFLNKINEFGHKSFSYINKTGWLMFKCEKCQANFSADNPIRMRPNENDYCFEIINCDAMIMKTALE